MNREDRTNQHGAYVPTETQAIRHIVSEEDATYKGRQLYGLFVRACCLCGFHLDDFTISRDGYVLKMQDLKRKETNK